MLTLKLFLRESPVKVGIAANVRHHKKWTIGYEMLQNNRFIKDHF